MISFRNVKKSFGDKHVLRGVSFDVQDGEVFFIIGASGIGKSVLIKHLISLLYPDDGEIWLDGEEVSRFDEKQTDWKTKITGTCGRCGTAQCSVQFIVRFDCNPH